VVIPNVLKSKSSLVNNHNAEQYVDYESMIKEVGDRRERTFVEMRNGLFLTIAANAASFLDIKDIYIGICEQDTAGYSDCTLYFLINAKEYINASLGVNDFELHAPLIMVSKADSIRMAFTMPDCWKALAHTHTSYDGEYPPVNHNHANLLRAKSFELAGLPDPLIMRAFKEGLMGLPKTENYKVEWII
jgi:7-cyano-7-deazaguanine synthase